MDFEVRVFEDQGHEVRTRMVPFEVDVQGRTYKGTFIRARTLADEYDDVAYEVAWEDDNDIPQIDESKLIDIILSAWRGE